MASGKASPRQKMINMMYLVLTALLALNVTKEVINAFVTINESVSLSKENLDKKNQKTYAAFEQAMSIDAAKYTDVNNRANNVKKAAGDLVRYIEDLKQELITTTDGIPKGQPVPGLRDMNKKDDYDAPTHIMCGDDQNGKGKKASELKGKIESLKKIIIANCPKGSEGDYQKRLDNLLNTSDPVKPEEGKRTWEMVNFYHNPVVASVALLTKIQSDVRNAESQVIDELLTSVDKNIIKLDKLTAKVISNSTVVTIGSDYQADIFLSATSSTLAPQVFVGATTDSAGSTKCNGCDGRQPLPVEGGYAKYTERPGAEGEKKWAGVIRVQKPDGSFEHYPFNASYIAQRPAAVVSADKMNVLYIGVDNPMSISVPGVPNDKVRVTMSGGSLRSAGGGKYVAQVSAAGTATVSVGAEIGGKQMTMGSFPYRIKRVPDPVATMASSKGGVLNKNVILAGTLIPILENFDFELFFKITEFECTVVSKGRDPEKFKGSGNQLSGGMRDAIGKARSGDKVYFEYIKARMTTGSDQSTRSLPALAFTIQ